jgi:hypothetical protein
MRFKGLRWKTAAVIAFLMGVPFVERAQAQDAGNIVQAAINLALGIFDAAGDS